MMKKSRYIVTSALIIVVALSNIAYGKPIKKAQPTPPTSIEKAQVQKQIPQNKGQQKKDEVFLKFQEKVKQSEQKRRQTEKPFSTNLQGDELKLQTHLEKEIEVEKNLQEMIGTVSHSVYDTSSRQRGLLSLVQKLDGKTDPKSLTRLTILYRNLGQYDQALGTLKLLQTKDPMNKKALILSAQIYRDMKQYEEATKQAATLQSTYPEMDLTAFMALLKEESGDIKGSIDELKKGIKLSPTVQDLYKKVGQLYHALGQSGIKLFIDGEMPEMDVAPLVTKGRTLVPARAVSESLGAVVEYDKARNTAIVEKDTTHIEFPIGVNKAIVNGTEITLEVPSLLVNGRLLVPIRFITEILQGEVTYDKETNVAVIMSQEIIREMSSVDSIAE